MDTYKEFDDEPLFVLLYSYFNNDRERAQLQRAGSCPVVFLIRNGLRPMRLCKRQNKHVCPAAELFAMVDAQGVSRCEEPEASGSRLSKNIMRVD